MTNKITSFDRTVEFMRSSDFIELTEEERKGTIRKFLSNTLIMTKRNLRAMDSEWKKLWEQKKALTSTLKQIDNADIINKPKREECLTNIRKTELLIKSLADSEIVIGRQIIELTPIISSIFSNDDLRSIFNISYADMNQLLEDWPEKREMLLDYIFMSWWAGETVRLFGKAVFFAMRSNPETQKKMDEGVDEFFNSLGTPVPTYTAEINQYGETEKLTQNPPKLKLLR